MADREKKIAAALAAVHAYLSQEESEAAVRQSRFESLPPPTPQTFWSLSGRQEIMNMRRLIQMRTFTSLR